VVFVPQIIPIDAFLLPEFGTETGLDGWPGIFSENIDAICAWPAGTPYAGKIYFLRGDEYIRFDIEKGCADKNYPQKINGGNWP
jgi:hypothetical protein